MNTFDFCWSTELGAALLEAMEDKAHDGSELYEMGLITDDATSVLEAVNQGIDAHLEACFIPDRGDSYEWITNRYGMSRLECRVSAESLPVLVRRLLETEQGESLASGICETLDIELI